MNWIDASTALVDIDEAHASGRLGLDQDTLWRLDVIASDCERYRAISDEDAALLADLLDRINARTR